MKTLIVPFDFSPASLNAAYYAADMAVAIHGELFLLNVVEVSITDSPIRRFELDAVQANAQKRLFDLRDKLLLYTEEKINVHARAEIGNLIEKIRLLCKAKDPFAIIMSSGSKSELERFFIGSHVTSTATNLPHPVLVIPEESTFKEIKKICFACDLKDIYNIPIERLRQLILTFNASVDMSILQKMTKKN